MNLLYKILPKVRSNHCLHMLMAVIFIFALTPDASAQGGRNRIKAFSDSAMVANPQLVDSFRRVDSLKRESLRILGTDSLVADSLEVDSVDSTISKQGLEEKLGIKLSPDALPSVVTSEASDSAVMNMTRNVFYLYGKAKVNYEDMELNAGRIVYDQGNNMVTAAPLSDSAVMLKDRPSFAQGQERFTYDTLQYNFKSKRAIVRNPKTQYGNGYVFSSQVKRNPDQTIYGYRNLYTTCALDTPHFGIAAKKIKVIPGRVVASGPANIVVEQVPTPLFLPFGLFPISKGQRSGFLLPTYSIEEQRGVGLLNGGYYFSLSKYADLEARANIFSKGSWQSTNRANYVKKYRYRGALTFAYAYNKTGEDFEPGATQGREFNVQWVHATDPKARPGTQFNASVNAGTSTFNANNTYDAAQILNNQYQSNITYNKSWANRPFTLSVSARHSQTAATGQVDVTLPEVVFFLNPVNPFQGKNSTGKRWYEKISVGYNMTGQNQLSFTDSLFSLDKMNMSQFRNGIRHSVPINASYSVLRFITLTVNGGYNEYWLTRQTFKAYDYTGDTVAQDINQGFFTARDYNARVTANTRIYGLKMFKKGKLMGIRHELRPNVGLAYIPDFAKDPYRFGYQTLIDPRGRPVYLSPYEGSIIGAPSQLGNYSSVVEGGFENNLQIKTRSDRDSNGFKNLSIIDNFSIRSGYDLAADSNNWRPMTLDLQTNLFNGLINLRAGASYSFYAWDTTFIRDSKQTLWERGEGFARLTNANVVLSADLKPKQRDANSARPASGMERYAMYGIYDAYYDFSIPWNMGLTYSLGMRKTLSTTTKRDTLVFDNNTVGINVDFTLTDRWKFVASTHYNFAQEQLQMTQFSLVRDMHCWRMELRVMPFGPRSFYNFTLNVKASELQDLKLMRQRYYNSSF